MAGAKAADTFDKEYLHQFQPETTNNFQIQQ